MTDFLERVKDKIKEHEGYSATPYQDSVGLWTVGYGTLIDPISKDEANLLFDNRFNIALKELNSAFPWLINAPDGIRESLVNMHYNLGLPRLLLFKNMLLAMEAGNYETAANEALDSKWARQVKDRSKYIARIIRYSKI